MLESDGSRAADSARTRTRPQRAPTASSSAVPPALGVRGAMSDFRADITRRKAPRGHPRGAVPRARDRENQGRRGPGCERSDGDGGSEVPMVRHARCRGRGRGTERQTGVSGMRRRRRWRRCRGAGRGTGGHGRSASSCVGRRLCGQLRLVKDLLRCRRRLVWRVVRGVAGGGRLWIDVAVSRVPSRGSWRRRRGRARAVGAAAAGGRRRRW